MPKSSATKEVKDSTIQGSAKTLAHLRAAQEAQSSNDDPWEKAGNDPWAGYSQPAKVLRTSHGPAIPNVEALSGQIENKVMQAIQQKIDSQSGNDTSMTDDTRMQDLEDRMLQLEMQVTSQYQEQQAQNAAMSGQIAHVQQQVDTQSQTIQDHFDRKLNEQLGHIEKLLAQNAGRRE